MRKSRVLKKIRSGKTASCFKVNLSDPRAVEIAAMSGFDCIWTDMEHVPNDYPTIENQIRAAKMWDVDTLVRVSKGGYSDYIRPLEMDAAGIMIPHVMSADEVREIVRLTRFHPVGRRPLDGGNADGAFTRIDTETYVHDANTERFVIIQIEDPEPLDELEEIFAVDGYDGVFFGRRDFSHGIGRPGETDHDHILETANRIAELAEKHGKFACSVASPATIAETSETGFRFISVGADVVGLGEYCDAIVTSFKKEGVIEQNR